MEWQKDRRWNITKYRLVAADFTVSEHLVLVLEVSRLFCPSTLPSSEV
jgi:hypothetical protein